MQYYTATFDTAFSLKRIIMIIIILIIIIIIIIIIKYSFIMDTFVTDAQVSTHHRITTQHLWR